MMAVATMMLIFVVVVIRTAVRGVVIGMPGIVVVMIVGVYTQGSHVLPHVPLQRSSRRPGELERNDNHDDQGDETAHGEDSTDCAASAKRSFIPYSLMPGRSACPEPALHPRSPGCGTPG